MALDCSSVSGGGLFEVDGADGAAEGGGALDGLEELDGRDESDILPSLKLKRARTWAERGPWVRAARRLGRDQFPIPNSQFQLIQARSLTSCRVLATFTSKHGTIRG